jgi:hypothetical protein
MIPEDPRTVPAQYGAWIESVVRENQIQRVAEEARQGQRRWFSRQIDQLLCELDYRRLVLAEGLARFDFTQSILRADEPNLFSSGRCS